MRVLMIEDNTGLGHLKVQRLQSVGNSNERETLFDRLNVCAVAVNVV
ncbi:MAG: hypothetical protein AAF221_13515 [Pseudomonadota bacterium]